MLLVVLLMVTVITVYAAALTGLESEENSRAAFNRFCTSECIDGKHNRNNFNASKLY